MQCLKSLQSLEGNPPNDALIDHLLIHFMPIDHLKDVSAFKALSDDAEAIGKFVKEGIFIGENEWVLDTGKDAYLIQAICELLLGKGRNTHLFQGVLLAVLLSLDPVYGRESALAQLGHHRVLIH